MLIYPSRRFQGGLSHTCDGGRAINPSLVLSHALPFWPFLSGGSMASGFLGGVQGGSRERRATRPGHGI